MSTTRCSATTCCPSAGCAAASPPAAPTCAPPSSPPYSTRWASLVCVESSKIVALKMGCRGQSVGFCDDQWKSCSDENLTLARRSHCKPGQIAWTLSQLELCSAVVCFRCQRGSAAAMGRRVTVSMTNSSTLKSPSVVSAVFSGYPLFKLQSSKIENTRNPDFAF